MILLATDTECRIVRMAGRASEPDAASARCDAPDGLRRADDNGECFPLTRWPEPTVATIGFFDGVHRGHQHLIATICRMARERKCRSLIVTFDNHPRSVLQPGAQPQLLSTPQEKLELLSLTGVDLCLSLPFTAELARLSAKEFMNIYLRQLMNVQLLVVGYNHRFGHDSGAGFPEYREDGRQLGLEVVRDSPFEVEGRHVSSSEVRRLLLQGDVETAAVLLGRPYGFEGEVIHGDHIGHTMGFPTVNFNVEALGKMLPADGSYAVRVSDGHTAWGGMAYVGRRPTFGNRLRRTAEINILDFSGDVYGHRLCVTFVKRLRGEQKFDSPEALRLQLLRDREEAIKALGNT